MNGPARIRTGVHGSEGRKDIQTTLQAQMVHGGWLRRPEDGLNVPSEARNFKPASPKGERTLRCEAPEGIQTTLQAQEALESWRTTRGKGKRCANGTILLRSRRPVQRQRPRLPSRRTQRRWGSRPLRWRAPSRLPPWPLRCGARGGSCGLPCTGCS